MCIDDARNEEESQTTENSDDIAGTDPKEDKTAPKPWNDVLFCGIWVFIGLVILGLIIQS